MSATELLPCPFCGGGEMAVEEFRPKMWWIVTCTGCLAEIGGRTREQAVERWNRRVEHDSDR